MNLLYLVAAAGFVAVTLIFFGILISQLKSALLKTGWSAERQEKTYRWTIAVLMGWAVVLSVMSLSGISSNFELFPFNAMPVFAVPLIGILVVTFSKGTAHILSFVPAKVLVNLQVFRLFVEILLWMLFMQNLTPVQMTFEGRNFDVISGITAPLAAHFLIQNRKLMVAWHLLCLGLLINIVATALLSMPTPFRVFDNEPANTIVLAFPFILLPGFLVPLAYGLHFLSLRQLANSKSPD